jgi:LCP family protein required for cell wall assembly
LAASDQEDAVATAQTFSSVLSDLITLAKEKIAPHNSSAYTIYMPSIAQGVPPTPVPPTPTVNPMFLFTPQPANRTDDEGRSWDDYAGPSLWPDMAAPAPAGILAHPEDQVNILLLGSDQREGDTGFRTDTIQLLTINPSEGSVKLTSFPRDLYVNIPGYTMQRINTAFGWGGFDALADTMEYNFGVRPEYYVLINLWSFVDVIDSIGGITVDIGKDLCDHRDNWGGDFCVSQGTMWMGGRTALWYVRSRYTSSDLDRGRRQQEVLEAAFKQVISLDGLSHVPDLYEIYRNNVSTNIPLSLAIRLIPIAAHQADSPEISRYSIGAGQVYNWTNYSGAMVLVPVRESVMDVMREVISEP